MSYIDKNLIKGEEVLYEGRISIWSLANLLLMGVLGTAFIFFKATWVIVPFLLGVGAFTYAVVKFASTELVVTNKRVVAKYGFVARRTVEISLGKVEGIEVQQTFTERLLKYGSIYVSGTGSHKARISNVHDPMSFRGAFLEALERQESLVEAPAGEIERESRIQDS
jgi:uncharacterized membrane protein YdbT with pleckstrin-like domain